MLGSEPKSIAALFAKWKPLYSPSTNLCEKIDTLHDVIA